MGAFLDKTLSSEQDMVNRQAAEVMRWRLCGLFRAFGNVKRQSEWKRP